MEANGGQGDGGRLEIFCSRRLGWGFGFCARLLPISCHFLCLTRVPVPSQATLRDTLKKFHAAVVAKDYTALRALFHPSFERYAFGKYTPEVVEGTYDSAGALEHMNAAGSFLEFSVSEPIGADAEGVFRMHYTFVPNGLDLSFSNTHMIHGGLVVFLRVRTHSGDSAVSAHQFKGPVHLYRRLFRRGGAESHAGRHCRQGRTVDRAACQSRSATELKG